MKQLFPATELQHSEKNMNFFIPSIQTGDLRPLEQHPNFQERCRLGHWSPTAGQESHT